MRLALFWKKSVRTLGAVSVAAPLSWPEPSFDTPLDAAGR